ncbi:hypothetical protein, partial [Mycobacterium tuberculosis]
WGRCHFGRPTRGPRMPMLPGAWDLGTWDRGD